MLCLGIETSCDDTGLALVEDGMPVHSTLYGQAEIHDIFGGVVPELASREHYRLIGCLFDRLLEESGKKASDIDYVCAARGPGLLGSLLVGTSFAKGLALGLGCPFLGINHLHAHILVNAVENDLPYPFLALLASGGHTVLYRVESPARFIMLGKCLDDAAGEILDKIGKFLGMPYPAGRYIDELSGDCSGSLKLPQPYLINDNLDFSFSGLKTAALQYLKGLENQPAWNGTSNLDGAEYLELKNFCFAFNHAVVETLVAKTLRAFQRNDDIRAMVIAGGVAANKMLRARFKGLAGHIGRTFICPAPHLCADNGIMIAMAGCLLARLGFRHDFEMEAIPKGRKMPDDFYKIF